MTLLAVGAAACEVEDLLMPGLVGFLDVDPDSATLTVGETLRLRAILTTFDGDTLRRMPSWSVRQPTVVTVNSLGGVTALAPGLAEVRATADGVTDWVEVRVVQRVAQIAISPDTVTLEVGTAYRLAVSLQDRTGSSLPDVAPRWESGDPDVARVDSIGRVSAVAPGRARIVARVGNIADTAQVAVTPSASRNDGQSR